MAVELVASTRIANPGGNNLSAAGYMLFAVFGFSLIPLFIDLAAGFQSPFLFNAWFRVGASIGCLLFLLTYYRRTRLGRNSWTIIRNWVFGWPDNKLLVLATVVNFEYALFAWSLRFISITTAAVLFETGPILVILFAARIFRREERYRKITFTTMSLILLSMAGFIFAIASQTVSFNDGVFLLNSLIGVILVFIALLAQSFVAFGLKWSTDLGKELSHGKEVKAVEFYCAIMALFITNSVSVAVSAGIGLASGERMAFDNPAIVIAGGIPIAFAWIAWRKANITTDNLGINALGFVTPIMSLFWLFLIAKVHVARWDYLVIGTAAVIAANLLINFEAEVRRGFKALILALGSCMAWLMVE